MSYSTHYWLPNLPGQGQRRKARKLSATKLLLWCLNFELIRLSFLLMRRLVTLLICVAGGLALSVTARANGPVFTNIPSASPEDMKRLLLIREQREHRKHLKESADLNLAPPVSVQPNLTPAAPANNPPSNPSSTGSDSGNPYTSIITRNVFGLNPVPVVDPNAAPPGPPPPKITLTGITTIFGPAEALFKVAGVVRDGAPPKDESYIFTEGEAQDDVEVTAIDTKKNVVTFNNHGVVQVIPLVDNGVASTGSAPPAPTWQGQNPRRFGRRGNGYGGNPGGPGGFQSFGQPQSYNNSQPYNGNNNNSTSGGTSGSSTSGGLYNPSAAAVNAGLTGDDEAALLAAQKAQLESEGNPEAAIFPPTPYDDTARKEARGGGDTGGGNSGGPPVP
jgi:hypothetical protein